MITVLESINLSTQYLNQKGIESPRTNAELLLAEILNCKRLDLYLSFERPLSEDEVQKYREHIKRRGNFEPLQYVIGKVEFYGLEFKVNPSVLIPRPETELLVENILNQFPKDEKLIILDIGSGSGNIAIALAVNLPSSKIVSTDVSEEALLVAKENSELNKVSERIKFVKHNILKNDLNNFPMFDVVVSNPPYVSKESYLTLQKEIKNFEPGIAVTDESDGYTFYRQISAKAHSKLNENGKLFFEVAQGQSEEVTEIMTKNNYKNIGVIKDYQNIDRVIFGEKK
ncbi:MAG TPA: peptide chain release factor N(5)-glutamine methyltransferase [Ignavibacteriaceae bacterium]|nr:peptide chain release factor N(5)-glutamine methyltransferase [Ignavibacteriaceae bacterium]